MAERPITGRRRLLRLASMTAQVASGYAKSRIRGLFQSEDQAEEGRDEMRQQSGALIAKTLGELKGAVMKLGQMASLAQDLLPAEVAEALSALQREAPPMPYDVIAAQVERELGRPPEALFNRFDRVPFASASIGQVHRATTDDGRDVVVKVQYPGVDEAVDSDLSHFRLALRASGLLKMKREALDSLFDEVRDRLHEELDYCNEADNVRLFGEHYRSSPTVTIPQVIGERSSQRVLTLTYEPGEPLSEAEHYEQETRNRIAVNLFSALCHQVFELGVLHADPNPANFAFLADGRLVIYDFGCIKRLTPKLVEDYRDTIYSALREDYPAVEAGLIRLGARNLDGPSVPASVYKVWRDILARPFVSSEPFDYGTATVYEDALRETPKFLASHLGSFQPVADLVFLDRVVVGYYGILRRLRARVNFRDILLPYLTGSGAAVRQAPEPSGA